MEEVKEALRYQIDISEAKHPVELFQELLVILYTKGYQDGQHYMKVREEESECRSEFMDKEEVLKTVIEAITVIEENPQKHLTDYKICEALYQARDYLINNKRMN